MVVYTLEQRCEILRHYFENHGNHAEFVRKLRTDFGRTEATSAPYVHYLVTKSERNSASSSINQSVKKPKTMRTPGNIAAERESVCMKRHQHQFTVVLNN